MSTAGTDFAACTVASRRYLAQARVLARSFLEHHPGGRFVVFIPDDPDRQRSVGAGAEELRPADIGLDDEELYRMALSYTVKQLSCAMKVFVFEHLVRQGDTTILLDGDITVHADLSPLAGLADRHGLVLTTHATTPSPPPQHYPPLPWRAPRMRNAVGPEQMAIHSGAFNSGVMAASGKALPFLEWWRERVARYCLLDVELGLFQEQGWIALAPSLFDCHILREPGWNVSAFELHDTDVSWESDRPEVRGAPLRCFHYITFDPAFPGEFTRLIQLANVFPPGEERPGAMRICRDYAERLMAAGHEEAQADVSPFDLLADGTPIDLNMRTAYAEALLEHEAGRGPNPPNPLRSGDVQAWLDWLSEPVEGPAGSLPVSRYLLGMHTRERWAFEPHREVPGPGSQAFLDWIAYGGREGYFDVADRWLPPLPAPRVDPAVASLEERNVELERRIAYYTGSLSWRLTAPLRRAAAAVRAWRRTA